jgi:hypothetical protein
MSLMFFYSLPTQRQSIFYTRMWPLWLLDQWNVFLSLEFLLFSLWRQSPVSKLSPWKELSQQVELMVKCPRVDTFEVTQVPGTFNDTKGYEWEPPRWSQSPGPWETIRKCWMLFFKSLYFRCDSWRSIW